MGFDLGSVNNVLTNASSGAEGRLQQVLTSSQGKDLSQGEMIQLQFELSKWQMVTNLQSNVMKTMSEGIKSTIQNLR